MRIAIIGSRNSRNLTLEIIEKHVPRECSCVVSGGAGGVDALAAEYAKQNKLPLVKLLPDYKTYGKQAPLVRNNEIVQNADLVLAFWDFKSRGTAHALSLCVEQGVEFKIIGLDEE